MTQTKSNELQKMIQQSTGMQKSNARLKSNEKVSLKSTGVLQTISPFTNSCPFLKKSDVQTLLSSTFGSIN